MSVDGITTHKDRISPQEVLQSRLITDKIYLLINKGEGGKSKERGKSLNIFLTFKRGGAQVFFVFWQKQQENALHVKQYLTLSLCPMPLIYYIII